jgi:hypothetical protein
MIGVALVNRWWTGYSKSLSSLRLASSPIACRSRYTAVGKSQQIVEANRLLVWSILSSSRKDPWP